MDENRAGPAGCAETWQVFLPADKKFALKDDQLLLRVSGIAPFQEIGFEEYACKTRCVLLYVSRNRPSCCSQCEGRQPPNDTVKYSLRWVFSDPSSPPGQLEVAQGGRIVVQPRGKAATTVTLKSFSSTQGQATAIGTLRYRKDDGREGRLQPRLLIPALILPALEARGVAFNTALAGAAQVGPGTSQEQGQAGTQPPDSGQQPVEQQGEQEQQQRGKRKREHQVAANNTRRWQTQFAKKARDNFDIQWAQVRVEELKGCPFSVETVRKRPAALCGCCCISLCTDCVLRITWSFEVYHKSSGVSCTPTDSLHRDRFPEQLAVLGSP